MKKILVVVLTVIFLMVLVFSPFSRRSFAYADPLSAYALGGIAYAIGQYSGLGFIFGNASSSVVSDYMESQIGEYAGGDIATKFALDEARLVAGKLIVGQNLYNDIKNFLSWLVNGKSDGDIILPGEINGIVIDNLNRQTGEFGGYRFDGGVVVGTTSSDTYLWFKVFSGQLQVSGLEAHFKPDVTVYDLTGWELKQASGGRYRVSAVFMGTPVSGGNPYYSAYNTNPAFVMSGDLINTGSINVSDYSDEPIDVGYQWEGTFPEVPDTNLDQLIGGIYEDVADTNLEVEGEITEAQPVPTPVPTIAPDIPLSDVPWSGLDDAISGAADGVTDAVNDAADAAEDAAEAAQSIDQSITDALSIPSPSEVEPVKFDLRNFFPFCIPFDIYRFLQMFDAQPAAPHVQIPIVIPSFGFNYTMDLDFSAWDPVAAVLRTVEFIAYGIALAWATGKVIKW